ncbi:MAG: hypothetical protein AAB681_03140 [Patescibacteria group bacterium]
MKTNNNVLVASIAIVVFLIAGYFLFKKPKVVVPVVVPDDSQNVISGNSVFVDQEKTLTFSYPKELSLDDISQSKQDWRTNTQDAGTLIARVTIPKGSQPQTNLSDSRFSVGVSNDAKAAKNCLIATNGEQSQGNETINRILYFKFILGDAGAGNFYDTTSYRTLYNGKCYAVEYTIHSTNIGVYDPSQGVKEFDKQKVTAVLEAMAHSFVFLKPDIVSPATKEVVVKPLEVLEDSRCPIYAKCIWMGTVKLRVKVTNKAGVSAEGIVTLGEPKTIAGVVVTLTEVMPAKTDKVLILSDYKFTFSTK